MVIYKGVQIAGTARRKKALTCPNNGNKSLIFALPFADLSEYRERLSE